MAPLMSLLFWVLPILSERGYLTLSLAEKSVAKLPYHWNFFEKRKEKRKNGSIFLKQSHVFLNKNV